MVVDERALRVDHGLLDRVELLRDLLTGPARLDHRNHRAQMPVRTFQPGDQGRMG